MTQSAIGLCFEGISHRFRTYRVSLVLWPCFNGPASEDCGATSFWHFGFPTLLGRLLAPQTGQKGILLKFLFMRSRETLLLDKLNSVNSQQEVECMYYA